MYAHRLSNKAGGYFYACFGKIALMVEHRTLAPCVTGSNPVLPIWQFVYGKTRDFDSEVLGSNPRSAVTQESSSAGESGGLISRVSGVRVSPFL